MPPAFGPSSILPSGRMLVAPLGEGLLAHQVGATTGEDTWRSWWLCSAWSPLRFCLSSLLPQQGPQQLLVSLPSKHALDVAPSVQPLSHTRVLASFLFALNSCFPSSMPSAPTAMGVSTCENWTTCLRRNSAGSLAHLERYPNTHLVSQGEWLGPWPLGCHVVPLTFLCF